MSTGRRSSALTRPLYCKQRTSKLFLSLRVRKCVSLGEPIYSCPKNTALLVNAIRPSQPDSIGCVFLNIAKELRACRSRRREWRPSAAGDGRTARFHRSSLYSPVGWFSWADAAKVFEQAQKNPALLQVFINTVLGETWAQQGEAPEWQRLYDRRETYKLGTVPAGALFLTAGADVQKDRIEVQIVGWGRGKESWLVDYVVLDGNASLPEVWKRLTAMLHTTYPHQSGAILVIMRMAVDSGFATQEVYVWARTQSPGRVLVCKGYRDGTAPVGQPNAIDVS